MATAVKKLMPNKIFGEQEMLAITIAANRIAASSGSGEHPYALRNDLLLEEEKRRIRYLNGFTLPASVAALENDALRKARHARTLRRNIERAYPNEIRPPKGDTHHIVAVFDIRAIASRRRLFNWGIAINDGDNGCYLPGVRGVHTAGISNAVYHKEIHTDKYHLTVVVRLASADANNPSAGRTALGEIKSELIAGAFPY